MSPAESMAASGRSSAAPAAGDESLLTLVKQLASQGSHLAEQQLALIQAEVRESATGVKTAVGGMLGAAVVGIAGLGVVLMGLAYLLGDAIDNTPLATLIVGLVTLVVAYLLYNGARKKVDATHLAPDHTKRTLERTPDALRGNLTAEQK